MRLTRGSSHWELILGAKKYSANSAWMCRRHLKSYPAARCLGPYRLSSRSYRLSVKRKSSSPPATIPPRPSLRFLQPATTGLLLVQEHGLWWGRSSTLLALATARNREASRISAVWAEEAVF